MIKSVGFFIKHPFDPSVESENAPRPSGLLHKELSKRSSAAANVLPRDEWLRPGEYELARGFEEALGMGQTVGRSHRKNARVIQDIQATNWIDCLDHLDRARELIQRHAEWFRGLNFPAFFERLDYAKERFEEKKVFVVSGEGSPCMMTNEFYENLSVAELAGMEQGVTDSKIALLREGFSLGYTIERDFPVNREEAVFFRSYWRCRSLEHCLKIFLEPEKYSTERVERTRGRMNLIIAEINRETSGCVSV